MSANGQMAEQVRAALEASLTLARELGFDVDAGARATSAREPLSLARQGAALAHQPAIDEQELTEARAGELLALNFGDRLRYTTGRAWLAWDGKRWRPDEDEREASSCARLIGGAYLARALEASRSLDRQFLGFGKRILSAQGTRALLEQGRRYAPIAADDADFDRDPWLLNTPAGIVDLRSGELRAHDPAALLTRITNVSPEPMATPTWERFLSDLFSDAEVIAFVERWFGYCCCGSTQEQRFLVAVGQGRNGKTTLAETVAYALGSYAATISTAALAAKYHASEVNTELARLPGSRFVICPEWADHLRVDGVLLKQLSGRDRVSVRTLYRLPFEFAPTFKLLIYGNSKPQLPGQDAGTWRRPILLPFERQFTGANDDKGMPDKLRAEGPGVLYRLIQACVAWQREGLRVPEKLEAATRQWKQESNDVAAFIADSCVTADGYAVQSAALYEAYKNWGGGLSQRRFAQMLDELGYRRERTKNARMVQGLALARSGDG